MKKKIVSVLVSVAIVATMLFTAVACGSKDTSSALAEPATVTNDETFNDKTSNEENSEDDLNKNNAEALDNITVDEWVHSDEAVTFVNEFNNDYATKGRTIELAADGEILCIIVTDSEERLGTDGSDLTDEQMEAAQISMEQQFEAIKDYLVSRGNMLKEVVGATKVRISYRTTNGTELFSQEL